MDGWTWASIDDVCAVFDSYAGFDVCHFEGYIDHDIVHDFFADGWLFDGTPYEPMGASSQQLSGYVRPGVYGSRDAFFTYPSCGAHFYSNGYEASGGMSCSNTGRTLPVRNESVGAWFFRPM